jgi:hypothetical protein
VRGVLEEGADGGVGVGAVQGQPPAVLLDGRHGGQALEELPGQAVGGHADRAAAGRLGFHVVGGAVGQQAAAGDDDDAVGDGVGLLQPVGGEQHRAARRHVAAYPLPEGAAGVHVQRGGGLVQDQQLGVAGQGKGQPHPLPLPARQPLHLPLGERLQVGQPQHLGHRERVGVQAADQADQLGHFRPLG